MKLIKLSIEKYRSILTKSEIPVGSFTTIIGPNNQGKSNILRGLRTSFGVLTDIRRSAPFWGKRNGRLCCELALVGRSLYDWRHDYPMQLQSDRRKTSCRSKTSRFTIDFLLAEDEKAELKSVSGICMTNNIIPIKLEFGQDSVAFSLNKRGRAFAALEEDRMREVASFITRRISLCYIDAERTAETAKESIATLIALPLRKQFETERYKRYLKELKETQDKILEEISLDLKKSLQEFLPSVQGARIAMDMPDVVRRHPTRRENDILLDDGVLTPLEQKGSGAQSLIAISIAKYISQSKKRGSGNLILAIEEPETHLHSDAIHQVYKTIENIARKTPVIITTHSQLLVNLSEVNSNIIVKDNGAHQAKSVSEIRDVLGVLRYDNLTTAECVLIVEGLSDQRILEAVLKCRSKAIVKAMEVGRLAIRKAGGTSKISLMKHMLEFESCKCHVVVDGDMAGEDAYRKLTQDENIPPEDITIIRGKLDGETELEDTISESVYWDALVSKFQIKKCVLPGRARACKWSERMRLIYGRVGGGWNEKVENQFKTVVADSVVSSPDTAIVQECEDLYNALARRIEDMLV